MGINAAFGQFFPGDSCLYRLDPRTKIVLTLALLVLLFLVKSFCAFALIAVLVMLCAASTKIGAKYLIGTLKPLMIIIGITFLLNLFLQKQGEVLVRFWIFTITAGGLKTALFMAIRLILLILSSQLLTITTSPIALTDGLENLLTPLSRIGFPAHEISMMMSIALRFIPTLMEETEKIRRAQMSRGADFETGNILERAKALVPLLVPLFVSAFRRADELAMAMEARCYRGGEGRTRMYSLKYAARDGAALLVIILLYAGVFLLNRFFPALVY